ncbi:winged helix-turn-helix domain-containing protein [Aliiroseovarius sp. S2029]|uniref:winged helix-turn-helix domain-containing tetratricopeptide repeat protein n=1 Tax=Aliiroseovarius sp. S2029 TaxID=2936988 RepID=UPI0020BEC5B0|nr:winged helix-turn-helix domain-containing protein [Aliiroseovarius sp. S2029]MCK8483944.1 winged helix-turn-helix domain-containing protein [Aliiroseovarius sp. S2029]
MKVMIADSVVDFDRMSVASGGQTHRLTRQSAGILRALFEAGGDIVSKDDLIQRVWDGRIITDATLSTAIKEARRAVGDTGADQRIIKTVHGIGFCLAVPTRQAPGAQGMDALKPCVVVLPFRNMGASSDDQFISDGLTNEIISNLSRFRDLKVLARTTSEAISAAALDHAKMGEDYGVGFVVEGSVRRSSERLRVTVQVASTEDDAILMTEQFNREASLDALFDVQDRIAELCAGRVASPHGALALDAGQRAGRATSWDMYRLVADFRRFYRTYDPELHSTLRDAFPAALARDPEAADGWSAYAVILLEEHRYHVNERAGLDVLPLATEAAEKAVAADPRSAFAYAALAMCRLFALDVDGFNLAAERALDLNPANSDVLSEIGHCYAFLAREDEAIALLDRAMELSPVHPGWYHFAKTWRYIRLNMYDAALLEIQKFPMPGFYWYHAQLVWLHSLLGQSDAAATEADLLRQVFPEFEERVYEEVSMWQANEDLVRSALKSWQSAGLKIRIGPGSEDGPHP